MCAQSSFNICGEFRYFVLSKSKKHKNKTKYVYIYFYKYND